MKLNRRVFLLSTTAALVVRPSLSAQSSVTSGGIGLTEADILSLYEEGPVGQSFGNYLEPQSGATLYIDFGDNDLARNIWVSGDPDTDTANTLLQWLCPDDVVTEAEFEILTSVGSIQLRRSVVMNSPFLAEVNDGRSRILATWVEEPSGQGPLLAKEFTLTIEQNAGRG